jgi:nitroreductase
VEVTEAIRRRHMVRSFSTQPIERSLLVSLIADARRAPSAGNTRGTAWIILSGKEETAGYWEHATSPDWRARSRRFEGLARAPAIALSLCSPPAYLRRYGEADKRDSGLGPAGGEGAWPVPYWYGDAAFATMLLLLRATDAGLGAAFLGAFRGVAPLKQAFGVPDEWRLFGAVLLGHDDGRGRPSTSLSRSDPTTPLVHEGRWGGVGS